MRAKKILLLSHIPQRDELVDMMVAHSLASENVCVWKYPILGKCREAICLIQPDIVILPEIRLEFTRDLAKMLQSWGVRVVQKRCEMGISAETDMTEELERCIFGNLDYASYIDLDLVWGQDFADMLIAHDVPKEKIKVVGGIGFDPYFTNLPLLPKRDKPNLWFATGFGYAECSPLYAAPESKPGEKINIELVKNDRENRAVFINMMDIVMKQFPEYNYYVRPHPGETYQTYIDVFDKQINNGTLYVTPVAISMADVIIHSGSTMAFEAHLMNKPTFNFRNTSLDTIVGKIAPLSNTVEELIGQLEKVELGKSNANPEVVKDLERYYGIVDGKAHQRAAEAILALTCNKTNIPLEWPKDTVKYITKDVYTDLIEWNCCSCNNKFYSQSVRSQVKCPYCGIACVQRKYLVRYDEKGNVHHKRIPV